MAATLALGKDTTAAATALTADGAFHRGVTVTNDRAHAGKVIITLTIGGTGPLTGLRVSKSAIVGGTHAVIAADAEIVSSSMPDPLYGVSPASGAHTTATAGVVQLTVDMSGIGELGIDFKASAATTVAVQLSGIASNPRGALLGR